METQTQGAPKSARREIDGLVDRVPGLQAAALVGRDGQVINAAGASEDAVLAFASFLLGLHDLGDRVAAESGRGGARLTLVACDGGHLAVHRVASEWLLLGLAEANAPLGVVVHDLAELARRLEGAAEIEAGVA